MNKSEFKNVAYFSVLKILDESYAETETINSSVANQIVVAIGEVLELVDTIEDKVDNKKDLKSPIFRRSG